jgi:hypothetical protein
MGVTKAAMKELEDATSALGGDAGDTEHSGSAGVEAAGDGADRVRAKAPAVEARRTIDELRLRYGIKKKGYAISVSDLDGG